MRALFLLLLGGTVGGILGVLLVTLDPGFGGDGDGGGGLGIGAAGTWLSEDALAELLERHLTGDGEDASPVTARARVGEDGLITVELGLLPPESEQPLMTVLNPEVVEGQFAVIVEEFAGGTQAGADEIAAIIAEEVDLLLEPRGSVLSYRLTAITTTDRRLTLEVDVIN